MLKKSLDKVEVANTAIPLMATCFLSRPGSIQDFILNS